MDSDSKEEEPQPEQRSRVWLGLGYLALAIFIGFVASLPRIHRCQPVYHPGIIPAGTRFLFALSNFVLICFLSHRSLRYIFSRGRGGCVGRWLLTFIIVVVLYFIAPRLVWLIWTFEKYSIEVAQVRKYYSYIGDSLEEFYDDWGRYPKPAVQTPLIRDHDYTTTGQYVLVYEMVGTEDLPRLPLHRHGYNFRGSDDDFVRYFCCASDLFVPGDRPVYYRAQHDGRVGWILISAGRDKTYDIIPRKVFDLSITQPSPALLDLTYDPTNGLLSDGDIWLMNQRTK